MFLPNYGVFDEDRYFQSGRELLLVRCGETLVGPTVCEDIWQPGPPATDLALAGAHVIANISASPFHLGKGAEREEMLATRARDNSCWIAFVNAVGAPGRADLRRTQPRARRRGHDRRPRALLRGGAARRRRRSDDRGRRRLRDARRRALARARRELPTRPSSRWPTAPRRGRRSRSTHRVPDELEQMRLALELGLARLRREERLPRGRARALGRDRLRAHRRARGRGARARARRLRLDAFALLVGGDAETTHAFSPRTSARATSSFRSSRSSSSRSRRRSRDLRGDGARTSPRRTSRRAFAACS